MARRLTLLALILAFALSSAPALVGGGGRLAAAPPAGLTPIYTGEVGVRPCAGDGFLAFATPERLLGADLNGDGDREDIVVRYRDLVQGVTINTKAIAAPLSLSAGGSIVAFLTDEGSAGTDLNGDGDAWDDVPRYYDVAQQTLVNIGVEAWSDPATDGTVVAFAVLEARFGVDLNGDGDRQDIVVVYLDLAANRIVNTGAIGDRPSLGGSIIAFETAERDVGQDLNGDGDARDTVIRYYDLRMGQTVNTGALGSQVAAGDGFIAFLADEFEAGKDLNGDGDRFDEVVQYYDLASKRIVNTGAEASRGALAAGGAFILFEQFELEVDLDLNGDGDFGDDIVLYYDVSSGEVVNTRVAGLFPCTNGWAAFFATFEPDVDADLNGDGDRDDFVVGYTDLPAHITLEAGWNLIALPRVLPAEGVGALLSSIGGRYELAAAYDPSRPDQPWRVFAPFQALSDLPRLDHRMGLWLKMRERAILRVPGAPPEATEIALRAGWNLIGFPARTGRSVRAALSSIEGGYDMVTTFIGGGSASWQTFAPDAPASANTLKRLEPGRGYWIHLTRDALLRVPY